MRNRALLLLCVGIAALLVSQGRAQAALPIVQAGQQNETPEQKKMREDMERAQKEFDKAMRNIGHEAPKAALGCGLGLIGCILIPIASLAIGIFLLIWVNNDAKSRGDQNAVIWMIVLLLAHIPGLIVYLVVRPKGNLTPCASCHKGMLESLAKCPHCGAANAAPKPATS